MTALPLAARAPLRAVRERIDALDLSDLLDGHEPARALWLDRLYRNFLFLCAAHPGEALALPVPVDAVWRAHASEPERYAADCRAALGWVPPRLILASARERFARRYREEFLVDPMLPGERELIDEGDLERIEDLCRRPDYGDRPHWDASRQLMRVEGDVAHWSGDLQVRLRRDGIAIVEWERSGRPGAAEVLEQLAWIFGPPEVDPTGGGDPRMGLIAPVPGSSFYIQSRDAQPVHTDWGNVDQAGPQAPLVVALYCESAAPRGGDSVLVRASAVWRCLRHRFSPELLEAAAAPDAIVMEKVRRHIAYPLLSRLSSRRRGLSFSTFCTRVFAAPGLAQVFRAVGELAHDTDLQLRLHLEPGQLLVLDNLAWLHGRTAFGEGERRLVRMQFASPGLIGMGLGFKLV